MKFKAWFPMHQVTEVRSSDTATIMTKGSTLKAIRRFCMACQGGSSRQVAACEDTGCALHLYRSGEVPEKPELAERAELTGQIRQPELAEQAGAEKSDLAERAEHAELAPCPPIRTVRRFCMACCANLRAEVRACAAREDCALWSFRFGCTPETWRRVKNRRSSPRPLLLPGFKK
ncbi:hypothetical protein LN040_11390 [Desulfovibrio subterraneus]|uniref:hypothetical protein n=1 Tax=Desulfovibrio subterraneus TaxID=2718620 RepID=UPI0022B8811A|nr:hypothetical protein [Desulfovibrio subterraneus]WBF66332.1 hypothetical protein LN040_11390 [Desulfovibrio subterraneus]